jgi:hypothetical protein
MIQSPIGKTVFDNSEDKKKEVRLKPKKKQQPYSSFIIQDFIERHNNKK